MLLRSITLQNRYQKMQYLPVLVEKFLNGPRQNPCDSVYTLLITRAIISPRYLQEFLTLIDRLDILLSIDWVGRDRECSFQTAVGTTITNQSDLQRKISPNWIFDDCQGATILCSTAVSVWLFKELSYSIMKFIHPVSWYLSHLRLCKA